MLTCAANPAPKKLFSRANVRSMYWSTNYEIAGPQTLLKRTDGAERDDPRHADAFHRLDVRTVVHLGWRKTVASAVPRQEDKACGLRTRRLAVSSDGEPNAESTWTHWALRKPSSSYRPVPPMIPRASVSVCR